LPLPPPPRLHTLSLHDALPISKPKEGLGKPVHAYTNPMFDPKKPRNATYDLWENFLACVRTDNRDTLSTPELGAAAFTTVNMGRSEEHTSELQSRSDLVCRLLL